MHICLSAQTILLNLCKYCLYNFTFSTTNQTPWLFILPRTFIMISTEIQEHTHRVNTSGVASASALIYQTFMLMFDCFLQFMSIETLKLIWYLCCYTTLCQFQGAFLKISLLFVHLYTFSIFHDCERWSSRKNMKMLFHIVYKGEKGKSIIYHVVWCYFINYTNLNLFACLIVSSLTDSSCYSTVLFNVLFKG